MFSRCLENEKYEMQSSQAWFSYPTIKYLTNQVYSKAPIPPPDEPSYKLFPIT